MNEGAPRGASDEEDNGVVIGKGNPFQKVSPNDIVIPPRPPLPNNEETQPLPVLPVQNDSQPEKTKLSDYDRMRLPTFKNGVSDDGTYFGTYRHWREPLLRLLRPESERSYEKSYQQWKEKKERNPTSLKRPPQKYGPAWYAVSVYGASLCIILSFVSLLYVPEHWGVAAVCMMVSGILLAYSISREVYRWRKRTVIIRRRETGGILITYGEPDNLFFGFNGDRNRQVKSIEGSSELTPLISWPNKIIFRKCGDLDVSSKIESGGSPLLENIPHVLKVHEFASRDTEIR